MRFTVYAEGAEGADHVELLSTEDAAQAAAALSAVVQAVGGGASTFGVKVAPGGEQQQEAGQQRQQAGARPAQTQRATR